MGHRFAVDDEPDAVIHLTARVNWQAWHLRERINAEIFYSELDAALEAFGMRLFAEVLMSNHFHLVVQSPPAPLYRRLTSRHTRCRHLRPYPNGHQNSRVISQFMRRLGRLVARRLQDRMERGGRFWECKYHGRRVRDEHDLLHTIAYDHRNPVRAAMVSTSSEYERSSARAWRSYPDLPADSRIHPVLPFGIDAIAFRKRLLRYEEQRRVDDIEQGLRARGLVRGSPEWQDELRSCLDMPPCSATPNQP